MKNFFSTLKQEILFEIRMFLVYLICCVVILLFNVFISFGISLYFNDFKINMIIPSVIYGLKSVFIENEAKNLLHYWHIIFFFAIMGVIHLPIFMKYKIDEDGNKKFIQSEKRTWLQWINRFFILLISNIIIVMMAGTIMLIIDYLISL